MNTTMPHTVYNLKARLEELSESNNCLLTKEIAAIILKQGQDDLRSFLSDVLCYGCVSGIVGDLVYYHDTHAFFDRHYEAIDQLRDNHELEIGQPIVVQGDLKNFYAWFAFELVAYRIASECGW